VTFPVISESTTITFKRLPRPVLVVKEISSGTASQMLRALGQIWKLFAFCLIAAAWSEIIIWFFDHKANSGHFPPSFWIGIREGLWWAIVTATTTGSKIVSKVPSNAIYLSDYITLKSSLVSLYSLKRNFHCPYSLYLIHNQDHRANQRQFPSSFWEGVREGAWWAVVTMTTVGYGDKTPKSLPARIYSAVWIIVGMIILSIFTAEVTSGLTSKELMPHHTYLGKKVS
ncbi:unnamed protein product, partial [Porites lobata]